MNSQLTFPTLQGEVRAHLHARVIDARGIRYGTAGDGPRFGEVGQIRSAEVQGGPAAFPQSPGVLDSLLGPALGELRQQEAAFTLRVQAPADAHRLPVLFFIPGGGFTTGSGESRWYKSQELVRQGRIVLVTVNYRIGVLGHFGPLEDPVESSKPIRDLQAALGWVGERFLPRWYRRTQPDLCADKVARFLRGALTKDPRTDVVEQDTHDVARLRDVARRTHRPWRPRLVGNEGADGGEPRKALAVGSGSISAALDLPPCGTASSCR